MSHGRIPGRRHFCSFWGQQTTRTQETTTHCRAAHTAAATGKTRTTQRQGTWTRGAGHTHILLLATAEEAGNVWLVWGSSLMMLLLLLFPLVVCCCSTTTLPAFFSPFVLWRERESHQPACVAHTTQRERDGSRVCPILLLLLAFGGGSERRDIDWVSVGPSVGCCYCVATRREGAASDSALERGTHTSQHGTSKTSRSFLDDVVPLLCCAPLYTHCGREGVSPLLLLLLLLSKAVAEASCSNNQQQQQQPPGNFSTFFRSSLADDDG